MTDTPHTPLTDGLLTSLRHHLAHSPRGTAADLARQLATHHSQPDRTRRWRDTLNKILNGSIRHPGSEVTLYLHNYLQHTPSTDGRRLPRALS
jgi:hypothetical protein